MTIWKGTIIGHLPRKSNQRRIIFREGKPLNVKSKEAINWTQHAILQIKSNSNIRNYSGEIRLIAHIYYRSLRSDLSDELLCDAFEHAQIIKNDRQIIEKHTYRHKDPQNPRVEAILETTCEVIPPNPIRYGS